MIATFLYDGDGWRVRQTLGGAAPAFVGEYYEAGKKLRWQVLEGKGVLVVPTK